MTATGAMVADASIDSEVNRLDLDRLERRYRLVYPLNIFLENARQVVIVSAIGLVIAASVFFLRHSLFSADKAPIEIQVFLVTAFASLVAVGYISLWALTVRNFWKLGSILTLVLALAFAWSLYGSGAAAASPVVDMLAKLRSAAPWVALLLLAVIGFTAAYYAHLIWALLEAAFALTLVSAPERKVLRDQPSRKAPGMGFFSRFWGFPPLFRFARGSPLRYAAIIVLSLLCAFLFSIVALLPLILSGPIDQISLIGKRCGADDACLTSQTVQLFYLFFLPLAALVVCLVLGWLGQLVVRRLLRFSLEALQQADTRPPVLFLRAFRDDQVPLRAPKVALFGRVLELGRRSNSLDQLLLEEATSSGPVVGLGSPTDKRPPYGAARGYFTGETWQAAVANLAAASAFTVICIDDTDGVWWEVEQLVGRHLGKTLFLIHPRYASATENALILGRLSRYFGGDQGAKALQAASPRSEDNLGWRRLSGFSAIRAAASPSCKPRPFHASPIFWRCAPSSASGRRR
jgi:hypothetical protein